MISSAMWTPATADLADVVLQNILLFKRSLSPETLPRLEWLRWTSPPHFCQIAFCDYAYSVRNGVGGSCHLKTKVTCLKHSSPVSKGLGLETQVSRSWS